MTQRFINVYVGKSGQKWFEIDRTDTSITMRPEYPSNRFDQTIHIPIAMLVACGFQFVGVSLDGQTVELRSEESCH